MAETVRAIMASKRKHKEQVQILAEQAKRDQEVLAALFEVLRTGSDVEKGTAAEVMKFVSKDRPDLMLPYIDLLIAYSDYKAPRVKWGCPESIGNIAQTYPHEVEEAIPKLLENLKDKSTVVRWCAAYALGEIAKYNPKRQRGLVEKFRASIQTEQRRSKCLCQSSQRDRETAIARFSINCL